MSNDTLKKLKETAQKAATFVAEVTGLPRGFELKTKDIQEKEMKATKNGTAIFAYLAMTAQRVEEAAKKCGLKDVQRKARHCKIVIKNYFKKWLEEYNTTDQNTSARHVLGALEAIYDLLEYLKDHLFPMTPVIVQTQLTLQMINSELTLPGPRLTQPVPTVDIAQLSSLKSFNLPNPLQ